MDEVRRARVGRAVPTSRVLRFGSLSARRWEGGRQQVVCFPPAGGTALGFRRLATALAPWATVIAVDPPGHGSSPGRPWPRVGWVAELAAEAVAVWTGSAPLLLGHSFGGYLAYEVARRLAGRGPGGAPRALVLVACAAPTTPVPLPGATGDDIELGQALRRLGGIPDPLLTAPALLRGYLSVIHADLRAMSAYTAAFQVPAEPLSVPSLVVTAAHDALIPGSATAGWAALSVPSWGCTVPGGHYLPRDNPAALAALLAALSDDAWEASDGMVRQPAGQLSPAGRLTDPYRRRGPADRSTAGST